MATARDRFHVNQRVQFSTLGVARALDNKANWRGQPKPMTGTVRGFGRESVIVRVQRDGRTTVESYHMDFLEPLP